MKHLKKLSKAIQANEKQNKQVFNYAIPELWDQPNVCTDHKIIVNDGHVLVNPYQFYRELIENVICKQKPEQKRTKSTHGKWIKDAFVYSMMVRTTGSFDHDRSGSLQDENIYGLKETGTFLKAIAYLPTLKRMGVDVIYMLPISKYSRKDKKGELGSPYGVSNFFKIDEGLKDPITGSCTVEEEFKAFVEACHLCGMRVIIDIIPRTNSVNSDYILDHPDWFYWISVEDLDDYKPPMVPSLAKGLPAKKQYFKDMFESEEVINHIKKFKANPKETDPQKWEVLVKQYKEKPDGEILDLVQQTFGLTIAPAFSDRINDPQPAWSDVTFFRLYLDHPAASLPYLKKLGEVQPYLLYDVAKSSYNPGKIINQPLWDTLTEIIPHFINHYGVDGARIDMGHALPEPLVESILKKAREADQDFTFIAEELDVENAKSSIKKGYNMIIGDGFIRLPRVKEGLFNSFVYGAINLDATMFAVGETHDTPRLSAREGDEQLCEMITLANLFIPNTVPFLNSGQEVFEKQPMNTGLDCRVDEAFLLDKNHPYYGKLALFDRFAFNYNHPKRWLIINHLEKLIPIRKKYLTSLTSKKNVFPLGFSAPWDRASGMAFTHGNDCLLVIVNTEFEQTVTHTVKVDNLPPKFLASEATLSCVFSSKDNEHSNAAINEHNILYLECEPFEVILFELTTK